MELKAVNTLCLLVNFLINKSHGFSQQVPSSHLYGISLQGNCCATNTTNGNDSKTYKCKGKTVLNESQVYAPTGDKTTFMSNTGKNGGTTCWYVEITSEKCKDRQTTTTSDRMKANNGKYKSPKEKDKVSCTGVIIGAALGGAMVGSITTVIVFLYFGRKLLLPEQRNLDCKAAGDENVREGLQPVNNETVYYEINDQAAIGIQPMQRPVKVHVSQKEEEYTHLHESDKKDWNEPYDHSRPMQAYCVREDEYGTLIRVSKDNGNDRREDRKYSTGCWKPVTAADDGQTKIQSDNYFIVEPQ